MKLKRTITKTIIAILAVMLGIGSTSSFATAGSKNLRLEYFRYINGGYKDGYAIDKHPIYQIQSSDNKTNYYCLNATVSETWGLHQDESQNVRVSTPVEYNQYYNLDNATDVDQVSGMNNTPYKKVVDSPYFKEVMWILDNVYVPSTEANSSETNLAKKQQLLEKAGIRSNYPLNMYDVNGNSYYGYRYVKQDGYDYSSFVSDQGKEGYAYFVDGEANPVNVVLPDELVEAVQQAAIWYFTNYKDTNNTTSATFNKYLEQGATELQKQNWITWTNGTTDTNSNNWATLANYKVASEGVGGNTNQTDVGEWYQEQAQILYNYLIDAATKNASNEENVSGSPVTITPATANIAEKKVGNSNYYVVGPITISKQRESAYELNNTISVNGSTSTNAYLSDANGNTLNKTVMEVVGQQFYVAVPKSAVNGSNITLKFDGTYTTNIKNLWVKAGAGEQPIVEVAPGNGDIDLTVTATVNKEFDLALRKAITGLKDSKGTDKLIYNEDRKLATRDITDTESKRYYVATDIAENGTATYNHRKDPVVVEKGDIISYTISVYNEGDMDGYAKTIVDKLPAGIVPYTYAHNQSTTGGIATTAGVKPATNYTYTYNPETNEITFTNETENVLSKYAGGNSLTSESITIDCVVTVDPSASTNKYLTNIAYISKEYNDETKQEVGQDRDSSTSNKPSATQVTEGDKYTGYHGGNNQNGDNNKDVYRDGTNNDDYFPGREDDDDFEVVVIKPVEFDLALQKYISNIQTSETTARTGRQEPTIDTTKLANKTATTATYTQDKTPIKVKSGDYVTYTFTVYNEGEIDGYVNKITDNIPTGLQFVYQKDNDGKTLIACDSQGNMTEIEVDESIYALVSNNSYWSIDHNGDTISKDTYNGESTVSITCDVSSYLGGTNKLLNAYDSSKDVNNDGTGLDRTSVTVVLRVSAPNGTGTIIRNEAAITEAEDKDGNKQDVTTLTDRDSQINQWPGKDGDKNYQDDEDYDNIILGKVDLALTKFIAAVSEDITINDGEYLTPNKNVGSKTNPYDRATKVDTKELRDNPECHDAVYTRVKTPLEVDEQAYVLYDIRVYNEGDVDVYAGEVTDYLPNYLDFVECDFNTNFGWTVGSDGKTIKTSYLSYENGTDKMLKAFDKTNDDGEGSGLDYKDLQVLCRVNKNAPTETNLVNSAEITKYEDEDGKDLDKDIDSTPENLDDEDKNKEERHEDDDDWEVVRIKKKIVDLALTKFIAAVSTDTTINDGEYLTPNKNVGSESNPYDRATKVDTKELRDNSECHDATYIMVKDPLVVPAQSYVLYDIRVYNEGEVDVYAGEVTDHLPEYLDFVNCEFNDNYGWKVESDGKTIKTSYLSHENGTDKMLKAFDKKTDNGEGSGLDYRDLQVLCKVNDKAPSNKNIVNVAEITKYEDKNGKDIDKDIDSTPNNVDKQNEDDDDYEVVLIKTFDLSLLKYVSTVYVTEDGKTTTTQTGNTGDDSKDIIPKVEIHRKKLNNTVVKFGYTIKITNEGDIAGYAKEITDYVPQGLKFYAEDNQGWTDEGNNVISTRLLENTLLQPGESATVTVIFRWINGSNNLGLKTNIAEISEDYNDEGVPDRDSTPDNKAEKEDDIDDAQVLLSISTGLVSNVVKYASIGTVILIALGAGIVAIKKFVL